MAVRQQNNAFVERVRKTIRQNQMIVNKDYVLVGLSGGADSIALAYVLFLLSKEMGFQVIAVHVNHMLRGNDSDADEAFVLHFCQKHEIKCERFKKDILSFANEQKLSIEQAGRKYRQFCFEETSKKYSNSVIATGHHQNDLVETFFINLFRGSSSSGLAGMDYVSDLGYIKPLLDVSRHEIEAFIKEKALGYCVDQSNFEVDYTRNKIRNELIPYIEENINPSIQKTICKTSDLMRLEKQYWAEKSLALFLQYCHVDDQGMCVMIEKEKLDALCLLEKHHLIRRMLQKLLGNVEDITYKHIQAVVNLNQTGKKLNLSRGVLAYLTSNRLILTVPNLSIGESQNKTSFNVLPMTIKAYKENINVYQASNVIAVDEKKICGHLSLRKRQDGDRFMPLGMTHLKKLKDFFIDQKIPQMERDLIPLLCDEEKIIWVCGYRQDERTRISKTTENILIISLE